MRVFVRTQLDLDETDLPNTLLDVYLQDGYDRVINLETQWPFFEVLWTLPVPVGSAGVPLPVDAREVVSIIGPSGRVSRVDARHAENSWWGVGTSTGTPIVWTQVGQLLYFYPPPSAATTYQARGYRRPIDWVTQGASAEADADDRLHIPITYYACSVAYAQQEDEVLEATYMNRFRESVTVAHDAVMRAWSGAPKIVNGYAGFARATRPPQLVFQLPPTVP